MEYFAFLVLVLFFLLLPFWWLNKQRWGRVYIIQPMKRASWFLIKGSFKLTVKLLSKVPSLFDPY